MLFLHVAYGEEYRTPLAGEEFHTELFGLEVEVPARDRRHVTAVDLGVQWIPKGPIQLQVVPFGALFIWHNWDTRQFRGIVTGVYNDVRYNLGSKWWDGWEAVFTFNNLIVPFGRSEYVEGQRIKDVELQWNYVFAGLGIGYRKSLPPGHQDNALEISLTYEPGYRWFDRSHNTSAQFKIPSDTYDDRVHFRLRTDALDRNLMELPYKGFAFGGDFLSGHRSHWQEWGGVVFDTPDVHKEKDYLAGNVYAVAAGRVPFASDRHRLVGTASGGIGKDLDRFSAFRLPGRPMGYEWEALSQPMLPGVAFYELFPRRYVITDLTYRYEALFFLFPYIRGTYAIVERPRFTDGGAIAMRMDSLPAIGGGIVTGAPWSSQVEVNYTYNFGVFRDTDGGPRMGGHGIFISWSKEF
ncbi:MAG TPA: hypothetical protein VE222_12920 [Nitrospiraceae bacterium]|nr:hypothetical protein [Nitrospiraceae bacterium]